ncbi:MAG TPA: restriction endonuclease subunit S, partial [Candidatus Paceibacterota bacterium]
FDYLPKSKVQAGDGLEEGMYPFYTSSENQTKYLNEYQHGPGCLVFGTGGKASVHFTTRHFSTSTDCITIRPKPEVEIDAGYVFQYFKGNMQVLENGFKGAGLKHISKAYLSDIPIPYPEELDDQRRIAHLLGKVEGLIAQRKQNLRQLDDLLKSMFLEMFGDPVRNERVWPTEPLGALATIERGRFSPRPRNDPKYYGGNYPFIQTGDISRSKGRLHEFTQTLNELGTKVSKEFSIDTIVIAIVGATIGETAILEIPIYAPDSVIGISPHSADRRDSVFIEYVLRFWKPVLRARAPDAARANINIETLRPLQIIVPPERLKFSELVQKIEVLERGFKSSLADLEALYGALSQKAFRGELDLSRVPLPSMQPEEENIVAIEPIRAPAEQGLAINLPDVSVLLDSVKGPVRQQEILRFWLDAYHSQLGGMSFSVQDFMAAAQTRLAELHPDIDFALGANDYEYIKAWVFESLAASKLAQAFDDTGNRIQLKAAQA